MPIKRCSLPGGGKGYKYGQSGKCYKNKKDAIKQEVAIRLNDKGEWTGKALDLENIEIKQAIAELERERVSNYLKKANDERI